MDPVSIIGALGSVLGVYSAYKLVDRWEKRHK
jgi:hypothetical protein